MMNSKQSVKGSMEVGGDLCPVVGEGSAQEQGEPSHMAEGEAIGEEEEETREVSAPPIPATPSAPPYPPCSEVAPTISSIQSQKVQLFKFSENR